MSVAKLLLSGFLVASGLILGAFTLHGYLDPQWSQRQVQATGRRAPARESNWVVSVDDRSRPTASVVVPQTPPTQSYPAKVGLKPDARPSSAPASEVEATAEKAKKRLAAKKLAEKRRAEQAEKLEKAKQQPQQAALQWPWNWFGN